jgi:hypothetical protein
MAERKHTSRYIPPTCRTPWNFGNRTAAINAYLDYQDDVRATVPKDQLLEFSVKV